MPRSRALGQAAHRVPEAGAARAPAGRVDGLAGVARPTRCSGVIIPII